MNTVKQLERDTTIMTMSHETVSQMNRYNYLIKVVAEKIDAGLATYDRGLKYVRRHA